MIETLKPNTKTAQLGGELEFRQSEKQEEQLRGLISQGWISLALILAAMNIMYIMKQGIKGSLDGFAKDPGQGGLHFLNVAMSVYAVMPLGVRLFRDSGFKWFTVAVSGFFTLAFIGHEIVHGWIVADVPFGIFHLLDMAHNVIGVWLVVTTVKWARHRPALPG